MTKTLEQTIHDAELPTPAPGGEDFDSYISRVAHAAAFIGAAWAIANGPQAQGPQPMPERVEPVADPTFDNPITVDGQPAEERGAQPWDARPEGEVTDGPFDEPEHVHQDGPTATVVEC